MLDLTKPVQTRDGRPARILATDVSSPQGLCVVIAVPSGGHEILGRRYPDGRINSVVTTDDDLINVPAPTITLELTPEQAAALWVVTQHIGGHPDNTPRGHIDKIARKLGGSYGFDLAPIMDDNSNYFNPTDHHFTALVDYFREKAAQ